MTDLATVVALLDSSIGAILTTALAGGLGYLLGLRRDSAKHVFERRSELLARFVTLAY